MAEVLAGLFAVDGVPGLEPGRNCEALVSRIQLPPSRGVSKL